MPGGDRTGPLGRGPYTGRGLNNGNLGYQNARPCFRRGLGRGLGRGYVPVDNSKDSLDAEKKVLEERIKYINSQLDKQ
ncbi:DUF5320 domain-containing protein [Mycoplasmatota bacterium WC30]